MIQPMNMSSDQFQYTPPVDQGWSTQGTKLNNNDDTGGVHKLDKYRSNHNYIIITHITSY